MRKLTSWEETGIVDPEWKAELLIFLGKHFGIRHFIETGTCEGVTLSKVCKHFDWCDSIELSIEYYKRALTRVGAEPNVHLYRGDSAKVLKDLLSSGYDETTLFWLDAHPTGGAGTANEGDPLPEEVRVITKVCPDALIVIDDESNCELQRVVDAGVDLTGWTREYHYGIVFLFKSEFYKIPEFDAN